MSKENEQEIIDPLQPDGFGKCAARCFSLRDHSEVHALVCAYVVAAATTQLTLDDMAHGLAIAEDRRAKAAKAQNAKPN